MSLNHIVTGGLLLLMLGLQIRNFIKFRKANGAHLMRILVFSSTAFMFAHTVKLAFGHHDGTFLLTSVVIYLLIYFKPE